MYVEWSVIAFFFLCRKFNFWSLHASLEFRWKIFICLRHIYHEIWGPSTSFDRMESTSSNGFHFMVKPKYFEAHKHTHTILPKQQLWSTFYHLHAAVIVFISTWLPWIRFRRSGIMRLHGDQMKTIMVWMIIAVSTIQSTPHPAKRLKTEEKRENAMRHFFSIQLGKEIARDQVYLFAAISGWWVKKKPNTHEQTNERTHVRWGS